MDCYDCADADLRQQDTVKPRAGGNVFHVEETAKSLGVIQRFAHRLGDALTVPIMLRVAEKYLHLLQVPKQLFVFRQRSAEAF